MKKITLLLACFAFAATTARAQEVKQVDPATGAKTEVNVRDNGTVKTTTTTGRTNTGEVIADGKTGTKRVAKKTGYAVKSGAKKAGRGIKKGAKAVKSTAKDAVD